MVGADLYVCIYVCIYVYRYVTPQKILNGIFVVNLPSQ